MHSVEVVVADAGPLIALARLNALPPLPALFSHVWVTETVVDECCADSARSDSAAVRRAIAVGQLAVRSAPAGHPSWTVDAGEASAIAAAFDLTAGVVMDDRAGRKLAERLGLPVVGTLGVLVLAKRAGLIAKIRPWVESLVASGYYLADSVIVDGLRLAGESSPPSSNDSP